MLAIYGQKGNYGLYYHRSYLTIFSERWFMDTENKLINLCVFAKNFSFIKYFVYHELRSNFDFFAGVRTTPLRVGNFEQVLRIAKEDWEQYDVYFIDSEGVMLARKPAFSKEIRHDARQFFSGWDKRVVYVVSVLPGDAKNKMNFLEVSKIQLS